MSRVYDYLEKLEKDKQLFVDILNSKDITSSSDETFSTLVPKVSSMVDINGYYDLTKKTSGGINRYIKQIPMIDTSGYTSMSGIFSGYKSLVTIPQLNTSNVTDMDAMFNGCSSLTIVPQLDTSNVTNMYGMFSYCSSLPTIPLLDTSNVTDMSNMFDGCSNLQTIPQLNTNNVTNMQYMFHFCKSLTTIPLLDTSNVTYMSNMFGSCFKLTTVPQLDTNKVTNMSDMFNFCKSLTTIPQLDASKVTNVNGIFVSCKSLTTLGGFTNLGQAYDTTKSANYTYYKLDLSYSTNLTHDSLMNVITNLYNIASIGVKPQQLKLGSTNLAKLTEEEIAIATSKGWNVVA